jgi:hypothetical protein
MVLSAIFITDLLGKVIISRNYRGDIPITRSIERFTKYITDTPEEQKKPIFQSDSQSEFYVEDNVGCTGNDGETYVYVNVRYISLRYARCFLYAVIVLTLFAFVSVSLRLFWLHLNSHEIITSHIEYEISSPICISVPSQRGIPMRL